MKQLERPQWLLVTYSLLVTFGAVYALNQVISSPSETGNAFLFGYSIPRLATAAGLFFIFLICIVIGFNAVSDLNWAERFLEKWFSEKNISRRIGWLGGISFGLGWIGCFLPAYRTGSLENYWIELQPIMLFLLLAGLATISLFVVVQRKITIQDLNFKPLGMGLSLFIACLLVMGWMFYTGFGVSSLEDYWYGAGVPILSTQLLLAIIGGLLFLRYEPGWRSMRMDVWICVLIYGVTAFFWAREPLNISFLLRSPTEPNHEFYPFVDANEFDTASQFPLIGEKIRVSNDVFFERPLYISFLVYLHFLFGQNYETLMAVQAGIFAVLPVLIYLIGRALDVRFVGFSSAIVTMFRGINSIYASNMIDMANSKMMLTDFPTAIGAAVIVLLACEWLKQPEKNRYHPLWIGGAIGFTLMLRTNALFLLAFVPLYLILGLPRKRKYWVITSCLIVLGVFAVTLPWEIRNVSLGGQMYGSIVRKIQNVIEQRYQPVSQNDHIVLGGPNPSYMQFKNMQVIVHVLQHTDTVPVSQQCDTVVCFSANHFLHNILTSILVLPTSPILDNLRRLILERNPHYWNPTWNGTFTGQAPYFLVLNLFLVISGVVFAWRQKHLAGLSPLAVFLIYNFSNALARTSGGRYIVPVDWIVPFYYLIGFYFFAACLMNIAGARWKVFDDAPEAGGLVGNRGNHPAGALLVFLILLGLGSLIPLSENLRLPRNQDFNITPPATLEVNRPLIEAAGLNTSEVDRFLEDPKSRILVGRALYPQYNRISQGSTSLDFFPYMAMGFSRTEFKLIGQEGANNVVLTGSPPKYLPHASDVLVIGCMETYYLDALVVIVLDGSKTIYIRYPVSELHCPLQNPACEDGSICQ